MVPIRRNVRSIDVVARFGGDEFVVLLVRSGENSAARIATKLRQQLLEGMKAQSWPVTFSIGVATFLRVPETVDAMVKPADELMYQVKHSGKDNINHAVVSQ